MYFISLTHFISFFSFYNPLKVKKISGFLIFSGVYIEICGIKWVMKYFTLKFKRMFDSDFCHYLTCRIKYHLYHIKYQINFLKHFRRKTLCSICLWSQKELLKVDLKKQNKTSGHIYIILEHDQRGI